MIASRRCRRQTVDDRWGGSTVDDQVRCLWPAWAVGSGGLDALLGPVRGGAHTYVRRDFERGRRSHLPGLERESGETD